MSLDSSAADATVLNGQRPAERNPDGHGRHSFEGTKDRSGETAYQYRYNDGGFRLRHLAGPNGFGARAEVLHVAIMGADSVVEPADRSVIAEMLDRIDQADPHGRRLAVAIRGGDFPNDEARVDAAEFIRDALRDLSDGQRVEGDRILLTSEQELDDRTLRALEEQLGEETRITYLPPTASGDNPQPAPAGPAEREVDRSTGTAGPEPPTEPIQRPQHVDVISAGFGVSSEFREAVGRDFPNDPVILHLPVDSGTGRISHEEDIVLSLKVQFGEELELLGGRTFLVTGEGINRRPTDGGVSALETLVQTFGIDKNLKIDACYLAGRPEVDTDGHVRGIVTMHIGDANETVEYDTRPRRINPLPFAPAEVKPAAHHETPEPADDGDPPTEPIRRAPRVDVIDTGAELPEGFTDAVAQHAATQPVPTDTVILPLRVDPTTNHIHNYDGIIQQLTDTYGPNLENLEGRLLITGNGINHRLTEGTPSPLEQLTQDLRLADRPNTDYLPGQLAVSHENHGSQPYGVEITHDPGTATEIHHARTPQPLNTLTPTENPPRDDQPPAEPIGTTVDDLDRQETAGPNDVGDPIEATRHADVDVVDTGTQLSPEFIDAVAVQSPGIVILPLTLDPDTHEIRNQADAIEQLRSRGLNGGTLLITGEGLNHTTNGTPSPLDRLVDTLGLTYRSDIATYYIPGTPEVKDGYPCGIETTYDLTTQTTTSYDVPPLRLQTDAPQPPPPTQAPHNGPSQGPPAPPDLPPGTSRTSGQTSTANTHQLRTPGRPAEPSTQPPTRDNGHPPTSGRADRADPPPEPIQRPRPADVISTGTGVTTEFQEAVGREYSDAIIIPLSLNPETGNVYNQDALVQHLTETYGRNLERLTGKTVVITGDRINQSSGNRISTLDQFIYALGLEQRTDVDTYYIPGQPEVTYDGRPYGVETIYNSSTGTDTAYSRTPQHLRTQKPVDVAPEPHVAPTGLSGADQRPDPTAEPRTEPIRRAPRVDVIDTGAELPEGFTDAVAQHAATQPVPTDTVILPLTLDTDTRQIRNQGEAVYQLRTTHGANLEGLAGKTLLITGDRINHPSPNGTPSPLDALTDLLGLGDRPDITTLYLPGELAVSHENHGSQPYGVEITHDPTTGTEIHHDRTPQPQTTPSAPPTGHAGNPGTTPTPNAGPSRPQPAMTTFSPMQGGNHRVDSPPINQQQPGGYPGTENLDTRQPEHSPPETLVPTIFVTRDGVIHNYRLNNLPRLEGFETVLVEDEIRRIHKTLLPDDDTLVPPFLRSGSDVLIVTHQNGETPPLIRELNEVALQQLADRYRITVVHSWGEDGKARWDNYSPRTFEVEAKSVEIDPADISANVLLISADGKATITTETLVPRLPDHRTIVVEGLVGRLLGHLPEPQDAEEVFSDCEGIVIVDNQDSTTSERDVARNKLALQGLANGYRKILTHITLEDGRIHRQTTYYPRPFQGYGWSYRTTFETGQHLTVGAERLDVHNATRFELEENTFERIDPDAREDFRPKLLSRLVGFDLTDEDQREMCRTIGLAMLDVQNPRNDKLRNTFVYFIAPDQRKDDVPYPEIIRHAMRIGVKNILLIGDNIDNSSAYRVGPDGRPVLINPIKTLTADVASYDIQVSTLDTRFSPVVRAVRGQLYASRPTRLSISPDSKPISDPYGSEITELRPPVLYRANLEDPKRRLYSVLRFIDTPHGLMRWDERTVYSPKELKEWMGEPTPYGRNYTQHDGLDWQTEAAIAESVAQNSPFRVLEPIRLLQFDSSSSDPNNQDETAIYLNGYRPGLQEMSRLITSEGEGQIVIYLRDISGENLRSFFQDVATNTQRPLTIISGPVQRAKDNVYIQFIPSYSTYSLPDWARLDAALQIADSSSRRNSAMSVFRIYPKKPPKIK